MDFSVPIIKKSVLMLTRCVEVPLDFWNSQGMRRFVCAVYAAVLAGPVAIARGLEAAPGLVGWVWYSNVSAGTPSDDRHGPAGVDVSIDVTFESDAELLSWTTTTEQGGRFVFHGLPPCRDATLRIASPGWGTTHSPCLRTPCPSDAVQAAPPVVELGRAKVTGRVVGRDLAGGISPIVGIDVLISVEGGGATDPGSIHATTGPDGVYHSPASLPLGATVVVAVEAATAVAAGIDTFEGAPAGTVRLRLEPTPDGLTNAPPPAAVSAGALGWSAAAALLAWLLPSQPRLAPPPPVARGLVAPDLVAGTYALCGDIGAATVARLHAGGNIPRSVRLLTLPEGLAEAAAAAGDALRVGPAFVTVPVGRDAVHATLHPSRMLSHRYSVVKGGAGPPSTTFCLRGLAPGAYLVHPALTVPEAAGGLRVEPPGRALWVGPRLPPHGAASSASTSCASSGGPRSHRGDGGSSPLSFEVLAPSISGRVVGLPSEDAFSGVKCSGSSITCNANAGPKLNRERAAPLRVFIQVRQCAVQPERAHLTIHPSLAGPSARRWGGGILSPRLAGARDGRWRRVARRRPVAGPLPRRCLLLGGGRRAQGSGARLVLGSG